MLHPRCTYRLTLLLVAGWLALSGACGLAARAQTVPLDPAVPMVHYIHEMWGLDEGLPQSTASALAQTPDGYLWIGTEEGLVRFNGRTFTPLDDSLVATAPVYALAVDAGGTLWIGTRDGLVAFDSRQSTRYSSAEGLDGQHISGLHATGGELWVGTHDAGLFVWEDGRFAPADVPLPTDMVTAVHQAPDGTLWVGTGEGLVAARGDSAVHYTAADGLADDFVRSVYSDRTGQVWVGTRSGTCVLRDGRITPEAVPAGLAQTPVFAFWEDAHGSLWMGTDGGGLARLHTDNIDRMTSAEGLAHDRIVALFQDREGSLWIGTEGGGLGRLRDSKFTTLTGRDGLPHDIVLTVFEDAEEALWIGTEGGGLSRMKDGTATTYTTADGLASDVVLSLHDDAEGRLWAGTYGGLNRLDGDRFETVLLPLPAHAVYALHRGPSGTLWIGTDAGVARADSSGTNAYLTTDEGLSSNQVTALLEARDGSLWIGTYDGGLNRYRDGAVTAVGPADEMGTIMTLYEDDGGALWVGTYGEGLYRIQGDEARALTTEQGLFSNTIYQILADEAGFLWMSSNRGLFRVALDDVQAAADGRIESLNVTAFGRQDGLQSHELNGGVQPAGWKGRDGTLWFPTVHGVAGIHPTQFPRNTTAPPVVIEAVEVDQQPVQPCCAAGEVPSLPPGRKKIELHFAALTYIVPEQVVYQYLLDGYDDAWSQTSSPTVTYTNLSPGTYTLRVRARNYDGTWSREQATFTFELRPFLYQRPVFWVILAAFLIVLGIGLYRLRIRHLKARQQELEHLVQLRTHDLREAKERIEEQAEQLREMDRFKMRFFANLSHEFRTPLTLMIGPMENALSGAYGSLNETLSGQVQIMLRNARRLLNLINQLLDLSKLEAGKMTLHARPRNLVPFLQDIAESFTPYAEQKQIDLQFQADAEAVEVYYEPDKLEKVVFNLLSNAIKHTPADGRITLSLTEQEPTADAPDGSATIRVQDTGPGIPEDQLPRIFDRFQQLDDAEAYTGTGIGLALVQELVQLHGGTIDVESTVGEGTILTITLRKGHAHLDPEALTPTTAGDEAATDRPASSHSMPPMESDASFATWDAAPAAPAEDLPHLLIVDDNADIRDYVRSCLQDRYAILEAANGVEGLAQARSRKPDLIITDIMMPQMDGYELCAQIKQDKDLQHIPVILLSAKTSQETVLRGLQIGADEYIAKPFNARELRVRIKNILKLRAQERQLKAWNEHLQEKVKAQLEIILQEREAYEAQLVAARDKAEAAAQLKTTILNNMSHEFRTPLTTIIGSADLLAMELPEEQQELVHFIQEGSRRLQNTLVAILELSELETAVLQPHREPVEVVETIQHVVDGLRPQAMEKNLKLHFAPQMPALHSTHDPDSLVRIAQILIDNAIKFTERGDVRVSLDRERDHIVLRVRDTGLGISEEFVPHLFEAFFQESTGDSRSYEGSGLGLTIAKRLVDLSNGTITVESTRGKGSTFTVSLPCDPPPEAHGDGLARSVKKMLPKKVWS